MFAANTSSNTALAANEPSSQTAHFYSPSDAVVETIVMTTESVSEGTTLFTLRSPEFERRQARLNSLVAVIDVLERPLIDGNAEALVDSMKRDITIADVGISAGNTYTYWAQRQPNRAHDAPARALLSKAQTAKPVAVKAHKHAASGLIDARDMIGVIRQYVQSEFAALLSLQAALTGTSSYRGKFEPAVTAGRFQKKGGPIGRLTRTP